MARDPFEPARMKNVALRNRFVFAAAASGGAADLSGVIRMEEIDRLSRYAREGVGLVITGAVGIGEGAVSHPCSTLLSEDRHVKGFSRLTEAVHRCGGAVAAQLCHSGVWTGGYLKTLEREAIGPSIISPGPYTARPGFSDNYHAATGEEIHEVIASFARAAGNAKKAGFDAVEVHGAHDSLLAQFLSPMTNTRTDEWGGTVEHRARLHQEVGRAIRKQVGPDYLVLLKIGAEDGLPGGLTFRDGREAARLCASGGYDVLEVSQGLQGSKFSEMALRSPINTPGQEGFSRSWCREIKKDGATTIMTGGLRSLELVQEVIAKGETDFVGLCRPLIREPGLVRRWKEGDISRSTCISCNKCAIAIAKGLPLACYVDE